MTAATSEALVIAAWVIPAAFLFAAGLAGFGIFQAKRSLSEVPFARRHPALNALLRAVIVIYNGFTLIGMWLP